MKKVFSSILALLVLLSCVPLATIGAAATGAPEFVMESGKWGREEWGNLSFADNSVTTDVAYQALYTTVEGFKPNTRYSLSFNMSAGLELSAKELRVIESENLKDKSLWKGSIYQGTKQNLVDASTLKVVPYTAQHANGHGSTYVEFTTTNETSYSFIIKLSKFSGTYDGAAITLSDFAVHENPTGIFALSKWTKTDKNQYGMLYPDSPYKDSVRLYGLQWKDAYCDLGELEANTTYTLTYKVDHAAENVFRYVTETTRCGIIGNTLTEINNWYTQNSGAAIDFEKSEFKDYATAEGAIHTRTASTETYTFTTDEAKNYYLIVSIRDYGSYLTGEQYVTLYEPSLIKVGHAFTPKTGTNLNGQSPAASLRPESETKQAGIRIKSTILKQSVAANKVVEYGYLVTKANFLKDETAGTEHAKDSSFVVGGTVAMPTNCPAKVYKNNTAIYDITEGQLSNEFGCVLIGIQPKDYATVYSVRAYSKDSESNYYYGDVVDVCMYDVVYAIDSTEGAAETDVAAAKEVVARATSDNGALSYAEWLKSKGYESKNLKQSTGVLWYEKGIYFASY